jgi:phenylpropionate dioxygenase-like ring-hydroxylating dioxygenase large terminal subunit
VGAPFRQRFREHTENKPRRGTEDASLACDFSVPFAGTRPMFVHSTHLPQRFTPERYSSPEVFDIEREELFSRSWHCIGTLADLPREGDYFTFKLLDHPLICWRTSGDLHTYLNVCCHRFCQLTGRRSGHFGDRIRCQYHGWEYDSTGRPRKIPDAPSFRPLVKNQLALRQYRTETVGQLIFVSLAEDGPSLREFLGDRYFELCAEWFSASRRYTGTFDHGTDCNWKILVENVLESYHISTLHSHTLGMYPGAESCRHRFYDDGDECVMYYRQSAARMFKEWAISTLAGVKPDYKWHHLIRYPNLIIANSSLVTYVQCVIPVGVGRCLNLFRAFHDSGARGVVRRGLADLLLRVGGRSFVRRVLQEDAAIYPQVQAGASAAELPGDGLISAREERIFAFQEYVLEHASAPGPIGSETTPWARAHHIPR